MAERLFITSAFAFLLLGSAGAAAGTEIVVRSDEAKMLSVSGEPSTIVVGNPNVADVTVHGNQLFVHGRNFGSTNLIVVDRDGNQLANLDVTVMQGGTQNLTVFRGGGKYSYVCAPECQVTVQVGDKTDFFDAVADANTKKSGLATGASAK